ncbi:hypothetical protein D3C86_1331530 [compost metagenome]
MATPTSCLPLLTILVSKFSASISARPMSINLTKRELSAFRTILLNCSGVERFPTVFTVNSVVLPTILPEGNSTFWLFSAVRISEAVMP